MVALMFYFDTDPLICNATVIPPKRHTNGEICFFFSNDISHGKGIHLISVKMNELWNLYSRIHFWDSFWNGKSLLRGNKKDEVNGDNGKILKDLSHGSFILKCMYIYIHLPSLFQISRAEVIRWWQSTRFFLTKKAMTSILWKKIACKDITLLCKKIGLIILQ